ncbi:hypothetical protein ACIGG6_02050 [Vreelandella lionensis]|uniref:Uncharacterized protein n=1 Tax=Vreelandella lionensis TaxID=1144478 RepID=A0ABW8BNJ4_9GAMM
MNLLDGLDTALNSDAVSAAVDVGSQAASSNWWDTGIEYATKAFNWMEDHPTTTNLLAGVAGGVGQYLMSKEQLAQQERFAREQWERERAARRIKPGSMDGYGSHVATAKGGLLTNGLIIGQED